jgi:hypothetical protein
MIETKTMSTMKAAGAVIDTTRTHMSWEAPKPDFVFASGSPHELRVGQDGVTFGGKTIGEEAREIHQALRAALGMEGARGVHFFRNRGPGGIWVEADEQVIGIIEGSESRNVYELRTMYARPRSPLSKARMQELAVQGGFELPDLLGGEPGLLDRLFAFADAVRGEP